MKISFPGLIFAQYKLINIIVVIVIVIAIAIAIAIVIVIVIVIVIDQLQLTGLPKKS